MAASPYPLLRETRESAALVGDGTVGPYGPSVYKVFDVADVTVFAKASGESVYSDVTDTCTITKTSGAVYDTFSVTFGTAVPATTSWYHQARRTHERQTAATQGGAVSGVELEKELGRQATILSELRRDVDRAPHFGRGFAGINQLPSLADGETIIWDTVLERFKAGPNADDLASAEGFAEVAAAIVAGRVIERATRTDAIANDHPDGAPDAIRTAGYAAAGDGGGALYTKAEAEPSHDGKFQSADGAWWELAETIVSPLMFNTADVSAGFNSAAAFLAAKGRGELDLRGRAWSFGSPLTVDGSYITILAHDATVTFTHDAGSCLTLGNGATLRNRIAIMGGRWVQDNACLQYLFDIRYLRNFITEGLQVSNVYSYARWGQTGDAGASYKWYESDCEINLRWPDQATGHANAYDVTNASGGWYQSNITVEGREGTANDAFRNSYGVRFLNFVPVRFDHWMASNVIFKGFTYGIAAINMRLVNLQWASMRLDDMRTVSLWGSFGTAGSGMDVADLNLEIRNNPTGKGIDLSVTHSGASMGSFNCRLAAQKLTGHCISVTCSAGAIQGMNLALSNFTWSPATSGNLYGIVVSQSGTGAIDHVTGSVDLKSANGNVPDYGFAKFGTTTNFAKGTLNVVGGTGAANF